MTSLAALLRSLSSASANAPNSPLHILPSKGRLPSFMRSGLGGQTLPGQAWAQCLVLHSSQNLIPPLASQVFPSASCLSLQDSQPCCTHLLLQSLQKENLFRRELCILCLIYLNPMNMAFYLHHVKSHPSEIAQDYWSPSLMVFWAFSPLDSAALMETVLPQLPGWVSFSGSWYFYDPFLYPVRVLYIISLNIEFLQFSKLRHWDLSSVCLFSSLHCWCSFSTALLILPIWITYRFTSLILTYWKMLTRDFFNWRPDTFIGSLTHWLIFIENLWKDKECSRALGTVVNCRDKELTLWWEKEAQENQQYVRWWWVKWEKSNETIEWWEMGPLIRIGWSEKCL